MKYFIILIAVINFAITPKEYQYKLGIGLNVNWCLFKKDIKYNYYKEGLKVFDKFNTFRIRFNDKTQLKYLKKVVDATLRANKIPIIAYDAKMFKQNPNQTTLDKAKKKWIQVAKVFKNYPDILSFDLIIEPAKKIKKYNELLNQFYKKTIKAIRKTNPKRILFIAPNHIANPYYLDKLYIPNDKYIMLEWHFFAAGPGFGKNKFDKQMIEKKVKYGYLFSKYHNLYSWVGAIMPGNYNKGDTFPINKQIEFIVYIKHLLLDKYHIPFAINADGQFYDYRHHTYKRKIVLDNLFNK